MGNICGIDPGLDGALVLVSSEGKILQSEIMPTLTRQSYKKNKHGQHLQTRELDLEALAKLMYELSGKAQIAFLERVSSRPGEGTASSFKFGGMWWALRAMLSAFRIKYHLVSPQTWCKELHRGLDTNLVAKHRSQLAFNAIWPDYDARKNDRCLKNHDGIVDAALIAEWGRRQMLQRKLF